MKFQFLPRAILTGAMFLISTLPAGAYFDDGNDLLRICDRDPLGLCLGTIVGQTDMMLAVGFVCQNLKGANKLQIRDVILKYLQDHPDRRNSPSASLTVAAMTNAFSCKLNGQKVESVFR